MSNRDEKVAIFWFRRDLRLNDNVGLFHALNCGLKVVPIFIFDKLILDKLSNRNDARVTFIRNQIERLNNELKPLQSSLKTYFNTPQDAFKDVLISYNVQHVFTNSDYEPYALKRDAEISNYLSESGITFHTFKDQVIFEKNDILKADKKPYTIFTPYKNQWKLKLKEFDYQTYNTTNLFINFKQLEFKQPHTLEEIGFVKSELNFPSSIPNDELIRNYEAIRNFPNKNTSKMGLHLRFGTISIRQLIQKALNLSEVWLNELIWRDFFMMILYHFPYSATNSFKPAYDKIEWRNNEHHFECWCNGKTGYPLVDAGMRQLNATGFMHNRVRMVTASFLCKNLLIDWRWGESYFAEKLLDYDLSANVGNWQWASGSGCDAAPYFRVFNPSLQAEKFDKQEEYINKWIPEYGTSEYPEAIVDAKASAKKAIDVYKKALNSF